MAFTRDDLEQLYELDSGPLLSVYLHTDPAEDPKGSHRIWLKDALRDHEAKLEGDDRKAFREAAERINAHVTDHRPQGKSWVAFVGPGVFVEHHLQVPVENEIQWGRPQLAQLEWMIEEYGPYGVVLVDSQTMRFFVAVMNEITELTHHKLALDTSEWGEKAMMPPSQRQGSPTVGSVRGGNQREAYEQRVAEHTDRFWKDAVPVLHEMRAQHEAEGLLIGGPKDARERFMANIGDAADRVIGEVNVRVGAPAPDVLSESVPVIRAHERARETELVDELLGRASTSAKASVGLASTLKMIQEGRAAQVIVNRRLDEPLQECGDCQYVTTADAEACPNCNGTSLKRGTLRGLLPVLLRRYGSGLEIVQAEAADKLAEHDGIGTLLRF
ncbi:MAG: VLRF1 family aeRF1-type release factor [Candidatus Bipolaricaulia bacterium]